MSEAVHLMGVGGVGMAAVAELELGRGGRVSGCDGRDSATLARLAALGVATCVGHDPKHLDGIDRLVVSSAIKPDNAELAAALARPDVTVQHRSQALAAIANQRRLIAVAGTHGKTTTSAMAVAALEAGGFDPSYAVGSELIGRGSGARLGAGDVMVIEADESDGSFLNYAPLVAVVTNVELDHGDHYPSWEAYLEAFTAFADRILPGGCLIACECDQGARALMDHVAARPEPPEIIAYGAGGGWSDLGLTGRHLALNAEAAGLAAEWLGADRERARAGLAAFAGTARRFEERGRAGGVAVVDDYAHHPTEIAATLAAARERVGAGRVLVLFQPHLYSRTKQFARAFGQALAGADQVWLLDVYGAREEPVAGVDSGLIAAALPKGRAEWARDRGAVPALIARAARPGDIVLTMGAGDVTELGPAILAELEARG
ncbi:MAG: UDP-N-acetylmuramate--L-alanine ligase [Bifidobacteriaceae bacterium]|jgi:UDP-N-acetylmuramate--alanine ligase|nr:UDP-N-acetylmuramate--L-alanine ligase [Bifidobacteriaceae bacterium]